MKKKFNTYDPATRAQVCWKMFMELIGNPSKGDEVFKYLTGVYSQPQRHYHVLVHIVSMHDRFFEYHKKHYLSLSTLYIQITLAALWFHDCIRDPMARDNEERSIRAFRRQAKKLGLEKIVIIMVNKLIRATKHEKFVSTVLEQLICDLDLSVFASHPSTFNKYERDIRKEYDWVDMKTFAPKRIEVLERFLKREKIFQTPFFHKKYEAKARKNLSRSIEKLSF